jgi:hypothetical protein
MPILGAESMAQVIECLPSKHEALSSNFIPTQKKKKVPKLSVS